MPSQPRAQAATALVALQQAAGNAAVSGLVTSASRGGEVVVQRDEGLADPDVMSAFSKDVQQAIPSSEIVANADAQRIIVRLMDQLNEKLRYVPVKRIDLAFEGPRWGSFDDRRWTMLIGLGNKDVNRKDLQEFAVTIYHEARHAEQNFLEARYLVQQNPELDSAALRARFRLSLRDDALVLAMEVAAAAPLSPGQQRLVEDLRAPDQQTSDEEAREYIRRQPEQLSADAVDTLVAGSSPRKWKTAMVNLALDQAKRKMQTVANTVEKYNKEAPRDLSNLHDSSTDEHVTKLRAAHQLWSDCPEADQSKPAKYTGFLDAYRTYLEMRRNQAIRRVNQAYQAYSVAFKTEGDAYSVENRLREQLGLRPTFQKVEIKDPVNWLS